MAETVDLKVRQSKESRMGPPERTSTWTWLFILAAELSSPRHANHLSGDFEVRNRAGWCSSSRALPGQADIDDHGHVIIFMRLSLQPSSGQNVTRRSEIASPCCHKFTISNLFLDDFHLVNRQDPSDPCTRIRTSHDLHQPCRNVQGTPESRPAIAFPQSSVRFP